MSKFIKIRIKLQDELLGTASSNKELHSEYIASKAPYAMSVEEEIEAIGAEAYEEKSMTIFPKDDDGCPILWDYQVKGFFKEACGILRRIPGTQASGLKAYKKVLDGLLFIYPRKIRLELPEGAVIGNCQRPLRAETAQGERIALANSETVPSGTSFECIIEDMSEKNTGFIIEALEYGRKKGLGQWRNSGKGRFTYEILENFGECNPDL